MLQNVSVFSKEHSPSNRNGQYLHAHCKKLSTKAPVARQDATENRLFRNSDENNEALKVRGGIGHRAVECPRKESVSRNEPFGHGRRYHCFRYRSQCMKQMIASSDAEARSGWKH